MTTDDKNYIKVLENQVEKLEKKLSSAHEKLLASNMYYSVAVSFSGEKYLYTSTSYRTLKDAQTAASEYWEHDNSKKIIGVHIIEQSFDTPQKSKILFDVCKTKKGSIVFKER